MRLVYIIALALLLAATKVSVANVPIHPANPSVPPPTGFLTTFTMVNYSNVTLPAGTPVSFGQGFRYGDVMPGTYPVIRDAATHVALAGQQWDEIARFRENGGNSSWRHAVWAAWLPHSLAPGAAYTVEFFTAVGTYNESSHQLLSALCSGPAAHDLKLHLTDVRNQNNTVRDSGDATFDVCANISNAGRDAPRHLRAGNVYDEYVVSGLPVYTSSRKDPLLYVQAIIDIFTKSSDGISAGDVRWVMHVHNSWMNVASGSVGNPGAPGPAGFANDPQAVSYRAEIDDGTADVLDWSGLDATVSSASNPIQVGSGVGCYAGGYQPYCMNVPSSTGTNSWYEGQAVRTSCSGACVAGLTNDTIYYVYPGGSVGSSGANTTQVVLMTSPSDTGNSTVYWPMTGSQGTGTTTFSTRIQDYHFEAWQTLDTTGLLNWSPAGTTTRVTRKVYPALTAAEKLYWEESGVIIPLNRSQDTSVFTVPSYNNAGSKYYNPFGRLDVIGGVQGGSRADIGISNEYSATGWVNMTENQMDLMREFSYGNSIHGINVVLNEATGRIPAINNGPPVGPGGNGVGNSYPQLGAPMPQVELTPFFNGMTDIQHTTPNPPGIDIGGGTFNYGTALDHVPNFNGFTYMLFGERQFLDMMYWRGNAGYLWQRVGPGPELGQGYYRDNNATFTNGNIYHYYGLLIDCCQTRGSAWLMRDIIYPAAFGGDDNVERSYYHDFLVENGNYYPLWLKFRDGPGSTSYSTAAVPPNVSSDARNIIEMFINNYVFAAAWLDVVWLHDPVFSTWMSKYQRIWEGCIGGQLPNAPVSYYCPGYLFNTTFINGSYPMPTGQGGNIGQYTNGVDLADFALLSPEFFNVLTGGQLQMGVGIASSGYTLTAGDEFKVFSNGNVFSSNGPIDQLNGSRFYPVLSPDNSTGIFTLQCNAADHAAFPSQCPTAGGAFTGFTRGGVPIANEFNGLGTDIRPQFDPGPCQGYVSPNYTQYAGNIMQGLFILGYNVSHMMADWNMRCGDNYYQPTLGSVNWDRSVVIPGLPPAVNGVNN